METKALRVSKKSTLVKVFFSLLFFWTKELPIQTPSRFVLHWLLSHQYILTIECNNDYCIVALNAGSSRVQTLGGGEAIILCFLLTHSLYEVTLVISRMYNSLFESMDFSHKTA